MSDDARRDSEDVGAAIAATAATVGAPDGLRARIAAIEPDRRRRRPAAIAVAAMALALVLAVVLVTLPSGGDNPSVTAAAELALRSPNAPPPAVDAHDERFVQANVGTVRFPNYGYDYGWRVAGVRTDDLAGRDVVTVVYGGHGHRIGYSVVDGAALARPPARAVWHDGRRYSVLRRAGALVVTWRQGGHTCVLASRSAPLRALLGLASWS